MNKSAIVYSQHQQVLFRLQKLRGRLVRQQLSVITLEQELDSLWLSVQQDGSIAKDEVASICQMLNCFRIAMQSDLSH